MRPGHLVQLYYDFILLFDSPTRVDHPGSGHVRVDYGCVGIVLAVKSPTSASSKVACVVFGDRVGWTYAHRLKRVQSRGVSL